MTLQSPTTEYKFSTNWQVFKTLELREVKGEAMGTGGREGVKGTRGKGE